MIITKMDTGSSNLVIHKALNEYSSIEALQKDCICKCSTPVPHLNSLGKPVRIVCLGSSLLEDVVELSFTDKLNCFDTDYIRFKKILIKYKIRNTKEIQLLLTKNLNTIKKLVKNCEVTFMSYLQVFDYDKMKDEIVSL